MGDQRGQIRRHPVETGDPGEAVGAGVLVGGGRRDQRLGRDAPDVDAGAAGRGLLDHHDTRPGVAGPDGGGEGGGPRADDGQIPPGPTALAARFGVAIGAQGPDLVAGVADRGVQVDPVEVGGGEGDGAGPP